VVGELGNSKGIEEVGVVGVEGFSSFCPLFGFFWLVEVVVCLCNNIVGCGLVSGVGIDTRCQLKNSLVVMKGKEAYEEKLKAFFVVGLFKYLCEKGASVLVIAYGDSIASCYLEGKGFSCLLVGLFGNGIELFGVFFSCEELNKGEKKG